MLYEPMCGRLLATDSFERAISSILRDTVKLHGAEYGDVQLPLDDALVIVAQIGLSAAFLNAFMRVRRDDGSACGQALRERKTIVIPDVERDAEYAALRRDAQAAGYRAVQTTPLFTSDGELMGMVSTLFANVHTPTAIEMDTLQRYSVFAADHLRTLLDAGSLGSLAANMSAKLCAEFNL